MEKLRWESPVRKSFVYLLIVGGFSQGGAMTLLSGLKCKLKLAGNHFNRANLFEWLFAIVFASIRYSF